MSEFDGKALADKNGDTLRFTPTHFLDGNTVKELATEFGNKLDKTGDGKSVTVTFSQASSRGTAANDFASGSSLATLFGKMKKWFADLKAMAFKDNVTNNDISGTIADGHIASASSWNGKYTKPSGGIPKSDLASTVQASLDKADSALQSATIAANGFTTTSQFSSALNNGLLPIYTYSSPGAYSNIVVLKYAGSSGNPGGTSYYFTGVKSGVEYTTTFYAPVGSTTGSFSPVTSRTLADASSTVDNADRVDGYHIVVGSVGSDPNTLYFT